VPPEEPVTETTDRPAPKPKKDLLEGLNPVQREAVTHDAGPLLVVAGAGSGKTKVLTHRIAYLIREKKVSPFAILAITFTNKAAGEMKERVGGLVGSKLGQAMWVMTFHSACSRILRKEAHRLGFTSSFTIYDDADAERLIAYCSKDLEVDPRRFTPRMIKNAIGKAKDTLIDEDTYVNAAGNNWHERTIGEVYALYQSRLRSANAMDFDDLIMNTVHLFRLFDDVLEAYRNKFLHVLVDEFQDTNHAQYVLAKLLAERDRNIGVVGDLDQSIYKFRGADFTNVLRFEEDFPDARVITLEQNYRSTQTILSAANSVVAHNHGRKSKALWTDIGEGDPIRVRELSDEHAEARFVAAEVQRMVDEGVSRSEIAVFYRTNAQSRVLEDMLVRAQIGYQVIGGTKFYDRAEIKDAIAYLTFLVNPQDAGAFTRIANSPKRGLGQTSLSRVLAHADTMGFPVWEAALDPPASLSTAAGRSLERFMSTMLRLKERVESGAPVGEILHETLEETGYREALEAERTIEAQGRLENLEELVRVGREYDATNPEGSVEEFLQLAGADNLRDDEGLVTLMTMHNAKGLEFPIVFMIGMEDGVFPHSRALDEGGVEEERRLAYVGITRAMRDLTMTSARRRNAFGAESFGVRSRFIDEIPGELTDQAERAAAGFPTGRIASWSGAAAASAEATGDSAGQVFHTGDDVIHAQLGEGVVIGSEPGGIVVVRFAEDGRERKLMADYAPIRKR
jgi:ATP-dependent DNA helicase UvrD/PcrA